MDLKEDILESVRKSKEKVDAYINQLAEESAELFLSSKLGMEDEDDTKRVTKEIYVDAFIDLIKTKLL